MQYKTETVKIDGIKVGMFNFRLPSSNRKNEIKSLGESIEKSGLHQLIGLMKKDGDHVLIYGHEEVEARIYDESLSEEEIFWIVMDENLCRRNFSPAETCMFFLKVYQETGFKDKEIVEKFGKKFGIDSANAVYKYRKVAEKFLVTDDSPEIKADLIDDKISIVLVSDTFLSMDVESMNAFYSKIVKPLKLTRPEALRIKNLLMAAKKSDDEKIEDVINRDDVKKAIENNKKGAEMIDDLEKIIDNSLSSFKEGIDKSIEEIRDSIEGDIEVIASPHLEKNSVTVKFRVTDDNFNAMSEGIVDIMKKDGKVRNLLSQIVHPFSN